MASHVREMYKIKELHEDQYVHVHESFVLRSTDPGSTTAGFERDVTAIKDMDDYQNRDSSMRGALGKDSTQNQWMGHSSTTRWL